LPVGGKAEPAQAFTHRAGRPQGSDRLLRSRVPEVDGPVPELVGEDRPVRGESNALRAGRTVWGGEAVDYLAGGGLEEGDGAVVAAEDGEGLAVGGETQRPGLARVPPALRAEPGDGPGRQRVTPVVSLGHRLPGCGRRL